MGGSQTAAGQNDEVSLLSATTCNGRSELVQQPRIFGGPSPVRELAFHERPSSAADLAAQLDVCNQLRECSKPLILRFGETSALISDDCFVDANRAGHRRNGRGEVL